MDLAPQAKILPVSLGSAPADYCDIGHALANPALKDVGIINISCVVSIRDDSFLNYLDVIRKAARAGKVIVFAAGNTGRNIRGSFAEEKLSEAQDKDNAVKLRHLLDFIMDNSDKDTRKSLIFAGALDPVTSERANYSNLPGQWKELQERFLFAPGTHRYKYELADGTSFAAPYICAALADLCSSSPNVTPKIAAKALRKTAEKVKNEDYIYGRGKIRTNDALEWLGQRGYR